MNSGPYPAVDHWTIGRATVNATLDAVARTAESDVEGGAFWLGRRDAQTIVDAVVVPTGTGVVEHAGYWQVSPEVYGRVGSWAAEHGLCLLAVVHTHGGDSPARLSRQDRRHLVRVPGILAVVIGENGYEREPDQWGWYEYKDGEFHLLTGTARRRRLDLDSQHPVDVVWADETGCPRLG